MSPNRRIFLNIIATYGRSLYALVCGLFISRWVFAAAGKREFGLYGVVGGMMVIELLAGAMRRGRGGIAAVDDDMRQTYTVKHIRTLLSYGEIRYKTYVNCDKMESLPAQIVADSIICACVTVKRYACSIARICECADGATAESEIERSEGG